MSSRPSTVSDAAAARDFDSIYAEHFGFVWRCLRALGIAEHAVDDAAQDVFVVVHRRLAEFRGESSVRSWLYSIVRHVVANRRRTLRRKPPAAPLAEDAPSPQPRPDEHAQDREAADFVQQFLAQVSDKKREVFVLAMLEQMSMPEVADILGIPVNTAYTRLRDARLEFRRVLEERGRR